MKGIINILIADHSSYARLVLSDILHSDSSLKVVCTCVDGDELVSKAQLFNPDVILMDAGLPKNERMYSIKRLSVSSNAPIVLIGTASQLNDKFIYEARTIGIRNFIMLPENLVHRELRQLSNDIIREIKQAVSQKLSIKASKPFPEIVSPAIAKLPGVSLFDKQKRSRPTHIIVIGASTGGPQAIETVLKDFNSSFTGCILIAQHMPAGFTRSFAERLNSVCSLEVMEGIHGMRLEAGTVIIAPGDMHMVVKPVMGSTENYRIEFTDGEGNNFDCPSVDLLMTSVAKAFGDKVTGVILSGMGSDGARGIKHISELGGTTIVQDAESSLIFGMGKAAYDTGSIDKILPLAQINSYITTIVKAHTTKSVEA